MSHRPVENWLQIIQDAPEAERLLFLCKQILGDLTHYRHGGRWETDDILQLSCALTAYAMWTLKGVSTP